jgi:hypothetical protein
MELSSLMDRDLLPEGQRPPRLRFVIAGLLACTWLGAAAAQTEAPKHDPWTANGAREPSSAEPAVDAPASSGSLEVTANAAGAVPPADTLAVPERDAPSDATPSDIPRSEVPPGDTPSREPPAASEAPPIAADLAPQSGGSPASGTLEAPSSAAGGLPPVAAVPAAPGASAGISNDDVLEMARAQFGESTILAVIDANETRFDVSPRALVALKNAGVSEGVIEAMLQAETAKREAAPDEDASEDEPEPPAVAMPSEEFTKLSTMIERLASQQEAAEAARKAPEPPKSSDASPRAWIVGPGERTALAPTIAQVAFTDEKGGVRMKTLQSLAGKALAFVNPAVSGIATTFGGLFRNDNEPKSAVWALAGTSASRELAAGVAFEIEFGHTPGVDPDKYQPAIVQLVRTNDNYRLVAAAKTEGAKTIATTKDPIIEELVPTQLTRVARGRYRVQAQEALAPGEYALVLRPIVQKERRRRAAEASLGELLGGGTSQVLYLTWDFYVTAP